MGGRGGSSNMASRISGLDVTMRGETTRYYFTSANGQNFYQRGIGGMPEPTPLNMSAKEFKTRVESSGATTKILSETTRRQDQKSYEEDRRETNNFLNVTNVNRTAVRDSRSDAINNRVRRRRRR